jgi:DNA-binding CsgD family transcriptional regulator
MPFRSSPPQSADAASRLLELAFGIHAAGVDPAAWQRATARCRDWFRCPDALAAGPSESPPTPASMRRFAIDVQACAHRPAGACARRGDTRNQQRCAALSRHMIAASEAAARTLQARAMDLQRATWIVDRRGYVVAANAAARRLTDAADPCELVDGKLAPAVGGEGPRLWARVAEPEASGRYVFDTAHGETTLWLRVFDEGRHVEVELGAAPPDARSAATRLGEVFRLTGRQSELAALLATGHTLSAASRAMGISRETARGHYDALCLKLGTTKRQSLIELLRASGAV